MIYSKELPILGEYDVAVVGGGMSGVAAAIEAARGGAKTVIVEGTGMLGGTATSGLVGPYMTCYDRDGERQVIHGIFDEIVGRLIAEGGAVAPAECENASLYTSFIVNYHHHVTPIDSFVLQMVLDDMVREAGVEIFLYTRFADCITEKGEIKGLVLAAPEGMVGLKAKYYIDCSGNADLAAAAGVPTFKGSEDGQPAQPATLFFEVNGAVDEEFDKFHKRPEYPVKAFRMPEAGRYKINHERIFKFDACNARELTDAHIAARRTVGVAFDKLKKAPGFENAKITQVAPTLGIRESRHIIGEYVLTIDDLINGRRFDDSICVNGYGADVHCRDGVHFANFTVETADMYEIPYRCLLPKDCENLLVAGRPVSAESHAAGAIRVMPTCAAMGQAAGAAAAIALKHGIGPKNISTDELRGTLTEHGATVDI